jgi:transcriptional regulator GlxA family with amidase domain
LLDQVRNKVARKSLASFSFIIEDIAELLGFYDAANFRKLVQTLDRRHACLGRQPLIADEG